MSDAIIELIGDELAASMPEVSQHAIDEHNTQQGENHANDDLSVRDHTNQPVDKNGKAYNPATHEISALTGKAIKKRRGGNAANKSVIGGSAKAPTQNSVAQTPDATIAAQANATGQFAAGATVAVCVGIFGDEFHPVKNAEKDEMAYLQKAYSDYFLATGKTDLPPVMGLVVAIGMYVAPRMVQPKTKSKLSGFKDFVVGKFFSWRSKKALKSAEKQAEKGE